MKKKMLFKKKNWIIILLIFVVLAYLIPTDEDIDSNTPNSNPTEDKVELPLVEEDDQESADPVKLGDLKIIYIDVGQADASLIIQGEHSMLIDAGNNYDGEMVCQLIEEEGIEKLDMIIGSHPHADHIGGLTDVIGRFEIGQLFMPRVTTTTRIFEEVLDAIEAHDLSITTPVVGNEYDLGSASWQIIAPNAGDYNNLNDFSIGIRLAFGDHHFLFTGDAEDRSEREMLKNGLDLAAQVLHVGHHGSRTSSRTDFLKAVDPQYAVISVGEGNSYGLPHPEVTQRFAEMGITVYRTDLHGTVVLVSDGQELTFSMDY